MDSLKIKRKLAEVAGFLAMISLGSASVSAAESPITVSKLSLPIGDRTIGVEVFAPANRASSPAILVLHGAGGTLLDGPEMRRVARFLAAAGNTAYLVHYFDRTGTLFARDATMQQNFAVWAETVRDSIVAIQSRRKDSSRVGIYGYSLGGFLSLVAASDNPRVAAVVEHAGGVWNNRMDRIGKMPPVLMIHGERDARVPFEKYAGPLLPLLRARSPQVQTHFFLDEGHGFSQEAMSEVRQDAVRFFRNHLNETKG